jgi:hypothetical protein
LHESPIAATDLERISFLRAIPITRMRRGIRFPVWYFFLIAVIGFVSGWQCLRDLEQNS